jgi:hypothetical protein
MNNIMVNKFKRISTDVNNPNIGTSRLFKIYTFDDDSKIIAGLTGKDGCKCFFSDIGDILVINKDGIQISYFINQTATKDLINGKLKDQNIPRTLSTENNQVSSSSSITFLIPSKNYGKYFLYKKNSTTKTVLLYNTIPRPEYSSFYKDDEQAYALVADYCKEINAVDPICKCINQENISSKDETENKQFCMNDIFGNNTVRTSIKKGSSSSVYGELERRCGCFNINCKKDHPFFITDRTKKYPPDGKCPSTDVTICNTTISGGTNLNLGDLKLDQKCGSEQANIDCIVSDWGECINGTKTRKVLVPKSGTGTDCPELTMMCESSKISTISTPVIIAITSSSIIGIIIIGFFIKILLNTNEQPKTT